MPHIIPFQDQYRDDLLFCHLAAKDALGRRPSINEDLLDIQANYFAKGDCFWIALDDADRVVGMLGVDTISPTDLWLRRLYVKPGLKRMGIGSMLLAQAEAFAKEKDVRIIHTRFPDSYPEAAVFYPAKGFVDAGESDGLRHMVKALF